MRTGHREPKRPKELRASTGNPMWCTAAVLAARTMNTAVTPYPTHTASQACHHERPLVSAVEAIIIEDKLKPVMGRMCSESVVAAMCPLCSPIALTISNPEAHVVTSLPRSQSGCDGFEIIIDEESLFTRHLAQRWCTSNGEGWFAQLHGGGTTDWSSVTWYGNTFRSLFFRIYTPASQGMYSTGH